MTHRETAFVGALVVLFLFSIWVLLGQLVTGADSTVRVSLADVDQALGADDVSRAERAWRRARTDVARRQAWFAYADLGDAAKRIGDAAGDRTRWVPHAREAYVEALVHARAERSVPGVTRICKAFIALGDTDVAQQCEIIAASPGPMPAAATRR
jgi:hypothetical protein